MMDWKKDDKETIPHRKDSPSVDQTKRKNIHPMVKSQLKDRCIREVTDEKKQSCIGMVNCQSV
jgi:hypothetical protein